MLYEPLQIRRRGKPARERKVDGVVDGAGSNGSTNLSLRQLAAVHFTAENCQIIIEKKKPAQRAFSFVLPTPAYAEAKGYARTAVTIPAAIVRPSVTAAIAAAIVRPGSVAVAATVWASVTTIAIVAVVTIVPIT